jgi:PRTRC genetic system protein B
MLEHAVDPTDISSALSQTLTIDTGFIPPNVIWIQRGANSRTVVGYRPPQITGIWLTGLSYALHIPLPGLIITRQTPGTRVRIFALADEPSPNVQLYKAPLPNIGERDGTVCWGTVAVPEPPRDNPNDLSAIWAQLLGSAFVNHSVPGKSKKHPDDIRIVLTELHETGATEYPVRDLVEAQRAFNNISHQPMLLTDLIGGNL